MFCEICHCQEDRDDFEWSGGICGSCNRDIKGRFPKHKICKACKRVFDVKYISCPYCKGG